jgi:hypothetical protein
MVIAIKGIHALHYTSPWESECVHRKGVYSLLVAQTASEYTLSSVRSVVLGEHCDINLWLVSEVHNVVSSGCCQGGLDRVLEPV